MVWGGGVKSSPLPDSNSCREREIAYRDIREIRGQKSEGQATDYTDKRPLIRIPPFLQST